MLRNFSWIDSVGVLVAAVALLDVVLLSFYGTDLDSILKNRMILETKSLLGIRVLLRVYRAM